MIQVYAETNIGGRTEPTVLWWFEADEIRTITYPLAAPWPVWKAIRESLDAQHTSHARFTKALFTSLRSELRSKMLKAVTAQEGERWITVHPGGDPSASGVHVLIRQRKDGSYSVIGGAGGKLNHLRLTSIKSPEEYKQAAKEGAQRRREERAKKLAEMTPAEREQFDIRMGEHTQKIQEKEKEFRDKVVEVFERSGLEAPVAEKISISAALQNNWKKEAKEKGIKNERDVDAYAAQKEEEHVKDIRKDAKKDRELAVNAARDALAEKMGMDKAANLFGDTKNLQERIAAALSPEDEEKRQALRDTFNKDPELAEELYRLELDRKRLKAAKTRAEKASENIMEGASIGGWDVPATELTREQVGQLALEKAEEDAEKGAEEEASVNVNRVLIAEAEGEGQLHTRSQRKLSFCMMNGAFEGVQAITAKYGGGQILDEDAVRTLGLQNTALLTAHYLEREGYSGAAQEGLTEFMMGEAKVRAKKAVDKVQEYARIAADFRRMSKGPTALTEARRGSGYAAGQINKGIRILGSAMGSLEAVASVNWALTNKKIPDSVFVQYASRENLKRKLRALGLTPDDVLIKDPTTQSGEFEIPRAQWDKVYRYRAQRDLNQEVQAIKKGERNVTDWRPKGIKEYITDDEGNKCKLVLDPAQQSGMRFALYKKRSFLNYEAGTGKTLTALVTIAEGINEKKFERALVIMPASVQAQFADETRKFSDLNVAYVGEKGSAKGFDWSDKNNQVVITSRDKLAPYKDKIAAAGFNCIVLDEAHLVKQRQGAEKSDMSEAFADLAAKPEYLLEMTGTPVPNDMSELWYHLNILDPAKFPNKKDFMAEFGRTPTSGSIMREESAAAFRAYIDDRVYTERLGPMKLKGYKKFEKNVEVELTDNQKLMYRKSEDIYGPGMSTRKKAGWAFARDAANSAALYTAPAKDNAITEALGDQWEAHIKEREAKGQNPKIIIFTDHYDTMKPIMDMLKARFGYGKSNILTNTRGQTPKATHTMARKFNQDKNVKVLVATSMIGTGLNLQGATAVCFYHESQTASDEIQKWHRAYRKNVKHDVDVIKLHAKAPSAVAARQRLETKQAAHEMIGNA